MTTSSLGKTLLPGILIIIIVLLVIGLLNKSPLESTDEALQLRLDQVDKRSSEASKQIDQLKEQQLSMLEQLTTIANHLDASQKSTANGQPVETTNDPDNELIENKPPALSEQQVAELRTQYYDEFMVNQAVDPAWSQAEEIKIEEVLKQDAFANMALVSVECKSTICRLEVENSGPFANQQFVNEVIFELNVGSAFIATQPNNGGGKPRTLIYMTPEGEELPSFNP